MSKKIKGRKEAEILVMDDPQAEYVATPEEQKELEKVDTKPRTGKVDREDRDAGRTMCRHLNVEPMTCKECRT